MASSWVVFCWLKPIIDNCPVVSGCEHRMLKVKGNSGSVSAFLKGMSGAGVHFLGFMLNFKGRIDSRKNKQVVSLNPHLNPLFLVAFSRRELQHIPLLFVQASHLQIHEFHQITSHKSNNASWNALKWRNYIMKDSTPGGGGVIRESLMFWWWLKIKNRNSHHVFPCGDRCSPPSFSTKHLDQFPPPSAVFHAWQTAVVGVNPQSHWPKTHLPPWKTLESEFKAQSPPWN